MLKIAFLRRLTILGLRAAIALLRINFSAWKYTCHYSSIYTSELSALNLFQFSLCALVTRCPDPPMMRLGICYNRYLVHVRVKCGSFLQYFYWW
jgi:hypothetical protein